MTDKRVGTMKRVTMTSGKLRRTVVLAKPPFPKVGDVLTVKGEGAEWSVTKVADAEGILSVKFPKRRANG